MTHARLAVASYYQKPAVRTRLLEYCGRDDGSVSAAYVTGFDPATPSANPTWWNAVSVPISELDELLARGCDIARALADSRSLLFLLDLDYQNLDFPGEPFLHPANMFFKLEPAHAAVLRVFSRFGIETTATATGRGYHFVGRIPLESPVVDALARLSNLPSWFEADARRWPGGVRFRFSQRQARATGGLGLLTEWLAHQILGEAEWSGPTPVVLNGTVVGSGVAGRECVSIDFSHLGDPPSVRHVRSGFSAYQWHRARPDIFGPDAASQPPLVAVPRTQRSLEEFLARGQSLIAGAQLAETSANRLADCSIGIAAALGAYLHSPLAAFHARFSAERESSGSAELPSLPADLPPCVRRPLDRPNDLLLKPEYLQNLVRGLMARGWSAARIAALVEREYVADHQWGDRWTRLDPRTRADFDVRVFAGMIVTGADRLIDFNCTSSQEKGLCPWTGCRHDMREDRNQLRARVAS